MPMCVHFRLSLSSSVQAPAHHLSHGQLWEPPSHRLTLSSLHSLSAILLSAAKMTFKKKYKSEHIPLCLPPLFKTESSPKPCQVSQQGCCPFTPQALQHSPGLHFPVLFPLPGCPQSPALQPTSLSQPLIFPYISTQASFPRNQQGQIPLLQASQSTSLLFTTGQVHALLGNDYFK